MLVITDSNTEIADYEPCLGLINKEEVCRLHIAMQKTFLVAGMDAHRHHHRQLLQFLLITANVIMRQTASFAICHQLIRSPLPTLVSRPLAVLNQLHHAQLTFGGLDSIENLCIRQRDTNIIQLEHVSLASVLHQQQIRLTRTFRQHLDELIRHAVKDILFLETRTQPRRLFLLPTQRLIRRHTYRALRTNGRAVTQVRTYGRVVASTRTLRTNGLARVVVIQVRRTNRFICHIILLPSVFR